MKDTVLLVGHGSRQRAGNQQIEDFVSQWRQRQPNWRIDLCFIEFAEVCVQQGLARAAQHSERVIIVPLILNAAGHVKMEIPQQIATARADYPQTEFIYTPPLGACDPILDILKRRLQHAMLDLDAPDPRTTGVVLLARGSSDRMANGEVAKLARWLQESGEHEMVDIAFTGITHPRLERVVQRQILLGMTQSVILPYYLFTGTLMLRIERQVEHLRQQYPHTRFARGDYFGFEQEIFSLVEQRVSEACQDSGRMPCDGCKYRVIAQNQGHVAHQHAHHSDSELLAAASHR